MVARINTGKSISKALNYNEQKVVNGKAECILAFGFIKDIDNLDFYDKLHHFERRISLKLKEIANAYMVKIGFEKQSYLVYKHSDAGHPHIHIVSTNIQDDGSRISLHNLGTPEKARREIELESGLVKAKSSKQANWTKAIRCGISYIHN